MKILAALAVFVGILLFGALIALDYTVNRRVNADFWRRVRRWREVRNRKYARRAPAPPPPPPSVSAQFAASAAFVHLAVMVCAADGAVSPAEQTLLEDHLARAPVSKGERAKLREQLAAMLATTPNFRGVKRRLALLDAKQQAMIADLLIGVAGADGQVGPDEIRMLGRIYKKLGLEAEDVYSRVHAMSAGAAEAPPPAPAAGGGAVQLNMAAVQAKLAQSAEVSALLGDIFAEAETEARGQEQPKPRPKPTLSKPPAVPGASGPAAAVAQVAPVVPAVWTASPHGKLLARLIERPVWTRREFDAVAAELRLLPDGAIDALNETAFDRSGGPVLEGDDPIHVDLVTARELLA
jgi:tellurite resistance protein